MFDRYFKRADIIARHRVAPLRYERERFLAQVEARGVSREKVSETSRYLLHILEILPLDGPQPMTEEQIAQAASRWTALRREQRRTHIGNEDTFKAIAQRFSKFLGKISSPRTFQPFAKYLNEFTQSMTSESALAPETIAARRFRAGHFLRWYGERRRRFRDIRAADIEAYLDSSSASNPVARRHHAEPLRQFFLHAAKRRWCRSALATLPLPSLLRKPREEPQGPPWKEVMRLLDSARGSHAGEVRDRAVLMIFAMCGLRGGEAANLLLSDIDWRTNRLLVRRRKQETRQVPLDPEVVTALKRYVEKARPRSPWPNLFVTTASPFRPVGYSTITNMVRRRMVRLGIRVDRCGSACLRNARATHLLDAGRSFGDVADFLGHASTQRIKLYATCSIRKLREVAASDLVGAL